MASQIFDEIFKNSCEKNFWVSAQLGWISGIVIGTILIGILMVTVWKLRKNPKSEILTAEEPDYTPARKISITGNPTGNIVRPGSSYTAGSNLKTSPPAPSCGKSDAQYHVTSPKRRRESFKMINDTLKRFRKLSENQPELHV